MKDFPLPKQQEQQRRISNIYMWYTYIFYFSPGCSFEKDLEAEIMDFGLDFVSF